MAYDLDDTIAAIASASGGAARGIVRISGRRVLECLEKVFVCDRGLRLADASRSARFTGQLQAAAPIGAIPCCLYLWPTSRSYTREPGAEIHTFGSAPVLEAVLECVCASGARLARPGEFTLRAFLAGRLDLTQAEAVLGVIDAADQRQFHIALGQLAGGLAQPLNSLRERLLDLLAHLEAGLDFVEEDIEFISRHDLLVQLVAARREVEGISRQIAGRGASTDEPRVALVGLPNVGKSSLFNALAEEAASLVSPQPGATRDYVARRVEWQGVRLALMDTAGEECHAEGISIAASAQAARAEALEQADLRVVCLDGSRPLTEQERDWLEASDDEPLIALTKADLPAAWHPSADLTRVSSTDGSGLDELRQQIVKRIERLSLEGSAVASTAARCRESLRRSEQALDDAITAAGLQLGEELVAAGVRAALEELGQVVGAVHTDDLLDRIFSRFCIGK